MPTNLNHWLLKTEPETYSFQKLLQQKKTHWDGVRNFQARKFLGQMKKGDLAFIYHSGDEKAIVGEACVTKEAYPDPDPSRPGDWVQIDLTPVRLFRRPVTLAEIKANPSLVGLMLIKQSRLSVMPVSQEHATILLKLAGA